MKNILFFFLSIATSFTINAQGVKISEGNGTPDAASILELESSDKGFLPPRMTTAQRETIATPIPEGLQIYNTDIKCIEFYNGSAWCSLCSNQLQIPTAGSHVPSQNQIIWNWNTVSGATGYKYNTANDVLTATPTAGATFTQTGLSCGTSHTLYIWSISACGNSSAVALTQSTSACRTPKVITANGGSSVSTAQSKFGGASASFDGTNGYLSSPSHADFDFGTGNFTIELWGRYPVQPAFYSSFISNNNSGWSSNAVVWNVEHNDMSNQVVFNIYGTPPFSLNSSSTYNNSTWHHFAVIRNGNTLYLYINGTLINSIAYTGSINLGLNGLRIGGGNWDAGFYIGHIDEIRLSKGIARYSSNFTPQAAPFTNDSFTVLLMHCDGTNGSTVFTDDVN